MSDSARIAELEAELAALRAKYDAPAVSPLAPEAGFPDLPIIGGVTFSAASAGVKYQGRDDVMLAKCVAGSAVAGVFTRSATRSAPVLDCQAKLSAGTMADKPLFILVNSGNSNAFTGAGGRASVDAICTAVADIGATDIANVFSASTGVIGEPLPHDRIVSSIQGLHDRLDAGAAAAAAAAIMTTDTFAKGAAQSLEIAGTPVHIAGFAKGSGMIAPDMATMLVYIFSDVAIDPTVLQAMVSDLNAGSFNAITVDSDTSTSDSLMVVATGAAGNAKITDLNSPEATQFATALRAVMLDLAHLVVRDGEGATKFLTVNVRGAADDASAKKIALSIANSPLVKTAMAGEDPNWGRVVMAVGKSGEPADRDRLSIWFGDILVADQGWVSPDYSEDLGADYMRNADLSITADLGIGDGKSTVWTCDLTHQYITINADYRS
ncbi:arginine biosynthesis bifunctional protein ArgJ [Amylibacter marinus]|uniref:Arginine biosynthesis bifunctional protein ArgJ n=1 Tax=Amylibacter marinus TaxID=1475483 RepID=A0ABQ5VWG3_9RHOB|nr:bifunctional glutamate N-acetyltransferase/amino-acid acetyltransferase ArgJ [Amylibacter marinus]GLQ35556.1 arginine biosynthesis bifunctional protein ArgJ [Amylibacter marinus]